MRNIPHLTARIRNWKPVQFKRLSPIAVNPMHIPYFEIQTLSKQLDVGISRNVGKLMHSPQFPGCGLYFSTRPTACSAIGIYSDISGWFPAPYWHNSRNKTLAGPEVRSWRVSREPAAEENIHSNPEWTWKDSNSPESLRADIPRLVMVINVYLTRARLGTSPDAVTHSTIWFSNCWGNITPKSVSVCVGNAPPGRVFACVRSSVFPQPSCMRMIQREGVHHPLLHLPLNHSASFFQ